MEDRLEVDVANNILTAPGLRVSRAGFVNSGVSNHNRVVERHNSRYGAYWKSYDFAGSVGTQNIFTHPLAFQHDGGEIIFNLPNGLQGYYLVDGTGRRLDKAPISIVSNPAASDPTVRNGLSCIGCHTEGMKEFADEVRTVIESDTRPSYSKAHALQLYVEKSEMDALINSDMVRYQRALQSTGGNINDIEPVSRFHEAFHSPLDLHHASASVGLEPQVFLSKIRENAGLQSAGLLVLDSGQIKRDTWKSSFQDVIHALDYPQQVGEPPIVTQPEVIPGRLVGIPDPNLRTVIEEALGTKAITPSAMATLTTLKAGNKGVSNLTGLEFAVNLEELWISENPVTDLSPLAGCTKLKRLFLWKTRISDLSPLVNLTNLEQLEHRGNISNISPLTGLTKMRILRFYGDGIRDISALTGMTNLRLIEFRHHEVHDLSPLANLTHLEWLGLSDNRIDDISPLRNLSKLEFLELDNNKISNIEPLRHLTNLTELQLFNGYVSDVSPLAGLTNLRELYLNWNSISDVSPLDGLINLEALHLDNNNITDISPVIKLPAYHREFTWHNTPAFHMAAPIIKGPWLWAFFPSTRLNEDTDLLENVSKGKTTTVEVATNGAMVGQPIGDTVWRYHTLVEGKENLRDMMGHTIADGTLFGSVSINSPTEQTILFYVKSRRQSRVWFNGELLWDMLHNKWMPGHGNTSIHYAETFHFPVTLRKGTNLFLIAIGTEPGDADHGSFRFSPGTEYSIAPNISCVFSHTPVHVGDTFTLNIRAENVIDLAGWQFDVAFDHSVLQAIEVNEGDFLKADGGATFFQGGRIDNAAGKIAGLIAGRISEGGVSGSGSLLQVEFKAESEGEVELALEDFEFGSITGENIPARPLEIRITVEERLVTGDVNRDGRVSILDLILVAQQLGKSVPPNSAVDINGDGVVNIFDLTLVAQGIGGAAAPAIKRVNSERDRDLIEAWITLARRADDGSIAFRQGIANLQNLLASLIPDKSALLPNYPNPFNPDTWIPYQLAAPSEVTLTIYDMNGETIRRLEVGRQAAGTYHNHSRAAYWDGRNGRGESVASGLYFYTLRAGDLTATRRMLIRK